VINLGSDGLMLFDGTIRRGAGEQNPIDGEIRSKTDPSAQLEKQRGTISIPAGYSNLF
jgi:hypothetical protein